MKLLIGIGLGVALAAIVGAIFFGRLMFDLWNRR